MKTSVLPDKLVQIPESIYQSLGLREGMELDWQLAHGQIVAELVPSGREAAQRIRQRARAWNVSSDRVPQVAAAQRGLEIENDQREGRL
jgi:antitoxin component of MazEF toxin-antitoxin module